MTNLNELGLSNRLAQALRRAGFSAVESVMVLTAREIREIPGVGEKCMEELTQHMQAYLKRERPGEEFPKPEKVSQDLNQVDLRHLGLRTTVEWRLLGANIRTVGALLRLTEPQISSISHIGKIGEAEIVEKVHKFMRERGEDCEFPRSDTPEGETSLAAIGLSTRTANFLARSGVLSAEQLADLEDEEIMQIKGIGPYTMGEIHEKMRAWSTRNREP